MNLNLRSGTKTSGWSPGLNDVADIYELALGKDFVSGKSLTATDRLLSGIGLIAGSGAGYRYLERAVLAPEKYISEFERGYSKVAGKEMSLSGRNEIAKFLRESESTTEGIRRSPTLRKSFESPNFNKTDFYVRPNGEVLPAKGYRYVPNDAPFMNELQKTGHVPANSKSTYLSFNNYKNAQTAGSELQVPKEPRFKIEFDTKQIIDDLQIPKGDWNRADYLEPLTKDYPEFGVGGATQAITRRSFNATKITDLNTGRVLYGPK
jgi:hypothetical protein